MGIQVMAVTPVIRAQVTRTGTWVPVTMIKAAGIMVITRETILRRLRLQPHRQVLRRQVRPLLRHQVAFPLPRHKRRRQWHLRVPRHQRLRFLT
jgi:hypothetical protein